MLTLNYKQILKSTASSETPIFKGTQGQTITGNVALYKINNHQYSTNYVFNYYKNTGVGSIAANITMYWGLVLGTGTTPVTKEDYQLSQFCDSLSFLMGHVENNCDVITNQTFGVVESWSNNTLESITITEVGLAFVSGNTGSSEVVLVARKLLDTPIIFEPDSTHSVSYVLDFSQLYV